MMPRPSIPLVDLYAVRTARGWTQAALAAHIGITEAWLCSLETGRRQTSAATLRKLARVLRVSPARLTGGADAP